MKVLIEARREGYDTIQCGRTLTVGELISLLEDCDEDAPVFISNDEGYTFGSLRFSDIKEEY